MLEVDQTVEKAASNHCPSRNSSGRSNPSWLLPSLYDVEERMKKLLTVSTCEEDKAGETFAERAEWYYQKRPQLLAFLKDLYNGYITLLDRCQQAKLKPHLCRTSSQLTTDEEHENGETTHIESDAESTISYQQPAAAATQSCTNIDEIVTELVMKSVENDMLLNQVNELDQLRNESGRKIELLKKLLELLESERIILMNENVKLGYQVSSLVEENKGLASEAMFMKRKAGELARCVLRMREDHRVCILSQKLEDLQEQIYGLEKRNKEYYNMLVERDQLEVKKEIKSRSRTKSGSGSMREKLSHEVTLEGCFQSADPKLKLKKNKSSNWWEKVKNVDLFTCGLHPSCS